MCWRQDLENTARKSAPKLSQQDQLIIEDKYRQERTPLAVSKQQLQTQLNQQIENAKQYFSKARYSLNEEEQQLRSACSQRKAQLQQEHDTEAAKLDQKLIVIRNQATPVMAQLSQKLRQAQNQVVALRWQTARREKEVRRFASLGFGNYLRKI